MKPRGSKRSALRILAIILGVLVVVAGVGPLLVPVPPLENTYPPKALADPDSRFIEVEGIEIHYKQQGAGGNALILLHGFGASTFSWREVMEPLAANATVVAFDRPAFGLTERPLTWDTFNPYATSNQARLTVGLMDALGIERAVLVGNSAGGTVAALTALTYPERVEALILVDAAIYAGGGSPSWVRPLLSTPQLRHLGPLIVRNIREWGIDFGRSAWHDPTRIPPEFWEGYTKPLQVENWDRALWELTRASGALELTERLQELSLPVLVITGDDDRIVPTEQSIRLAKTLPNAELVVLEACGHIPQEECPEAWLAAADAFLSSQR